MQVSLMRQMEKSTRDFADWRKEREKEVMQLRRQVSLASNFHPVCQCPASTTAAAFALTCLRNAVLQLESTPWSAYTWWLRHCSVMPAAQLVLKCKHLLYVRPCTVLFS